LGGRFVGVLVLKEELFKRRVTERSSEVGILYITFTPYPLNRMTTQHPRSQKACNPCKLTQKPPPTTTTKARRAEPVV